MGETKMETHLLTPRRFSAAPVFGMTFTMMDIQNEDFPGARIDSIILDVGKHMHDSAEMNAGYALVNARVLGDPRNELNDRTIESFSQPFAL
jgi:hypothetical protein